MQTTNRDYATHTMSTTVLHVANIIMGKWVMNRIIKDQETISESYSCNLLTFFPGTINSIPSLNSKSAKNWWSQMDYIRYGL